MSNTEATATPLTHISELPRKQAMGVLVGVMLGILLAALDQTIVGTAMPRVIAQLHGLDRYAWVFTAYMLTSTVSMPIWGKLSDLYGRKGFYLGSMALFVVGSMLSGAAQSMNQLITFRALQGLGAGAMMPIAQAVIGDIFCIRALVVPIHVGGGQELRWLADFGRLLEGISQFDERRFLPGSRKE